MITLILLIVIAISSASSRELYQIEKLFLENYVKISNLTLPQIGQEKSLDSELAQFALLHQSKQFKNFNADPEFSAQILLKKENNWNQSIYLNAKQQSLLLIQVKVTHKQEVHQFDNQSIDLYIISLQSGEVIYSSKVKHLKLAKIPVNADLYEVRVVFNWNRKDGQNYQSQQAQKHIKIDTDFTYAVRSSEGGKADEKKANQKLKFIKNETDRIFMSSLQIWEQVQSHHQEHFTNQEGVYYRAYIQMIGVFLVNLVELMALKKTLKIQSII